MGKRILRVLAIFIFLQLSVVFKKPKITVFKNKIETVETQLSPSVILFREKYRTNRIRESVNLLKINLNDPYTELNIGVPNPINQLTTVASLATKNSVPGHRVIAATNAAFFDADRYPANLLAINNEIVNYGVLGENKESPTQHPVAFGINKSGKAIADYFTTNLSFSVNGKTILIDRINKERGQDKTILYTEDWNSTGTNEWGIEIIVEGASHSTKKISFGEQFTGIVKSVMSYEQPGNSSIPTNGFVISIQNKQLADETVSLKAGDPVSLSIAIDEKWQDAEYILAAGPLLVQNSKETISMPTNTSFVTSRHPRTAVGIDASGNVMLVTVDGKKRGNSNGTNLPDLAQYLISKGAHSAINLDGGGSTTMVVSDPGTFTPKLTNRPADGRENRVSAILQIVSIAHQ